MWLDPDGVVHLQRPGHMRMMCGTYKKLRRPPKRWWRTTAQQVTCMMCIAAGVPSDEDD